MRDITQPLTRRIPAGPVGGPVGDGFADQITDLLDQLDQARARAEAAEQERDEARAERDQLDKALEEAVVEIDAHAARSLPHLHTPDWEPTPNPVNALIAEQLHAEQTAPGFKGWD